MKFFKKINLLSNEDPLLKTFEMRFSKKYQNRLLVGKRFFNEKVVLVLNKLLLYILGRNHFLSTVHFFLIL